MSKKIFTEQELKTLRENKYTYNVTPNTISFTREFKTIFYEKYLKGEVPRLILENTVIRQKYWGNNVFGESPIASRRNTRSTGNSMRAPASIRSLRQYRADDTRGIHPTPAARS